MNYWLICFTDYAESFDCMGYNKLWTTLQEMGIPDHLTCLLRSLYAGQEETVRTKHGTMNLFKIGKRVSQGCTLSPFSFNLYTEYIRQNARLNKPQTGIKIVRRNVNNLRYTSDTILMAEIKEKLKSLLMKGSLLVTHFKYSSVYMSEVNQTEKRKYFMPCFIHEI